MKQKSKQVRVGLLRFTAPGAGTVLHRLALYALITGLSSSRGGTVAITEHHCGFAAINHPFKTLTS